MNVLKKCCRRSLKENRKRTAVTLVGVILASALITGVACLAESLRGSVILQEKISNGNFHYCYSGVGGGDLKYFQNNAGISRVGIAREVGYVLLDGSSNTDKPYLYIREMDSAGFDAAMLRITQGRLPENDSELLITRHIGYNGMVEFSVGDCVTMQIGSRMSKGVSLGQSVPYAYEGERFVPEEEKTYTIVGVAERPVTSVENRMAPGYSVFTRMDESALSSVREQDSFDLFVTLTDSALRHEEKLTEGLSGIKCQSVYRNSRLIRRETMSFDGGVMEFLYGMSGLAVAIIIVTGVFCIRNSFVISLTEKIRLYGLLACVGTTSRQQRRIVLYEAAFLAKIGIPAGILCGIGASAVLVYSVSGLFADALGFSLVFSVSVPAVLAAAILSALTILMSARKAAKEASSISPVEAIRATKSVRIGRREMKCPKLVNRVFGVGGKVAWRNLRRARRRYRTTVVSIVISVAVFIGLCTFVDLLNGASGQYYSNMSFQLRAVVPKMGQEGFDNVRKIAGLPEVERIEVLRLVSVDTVLGEMPLTDEFKNRFLGEAAESDDTYGIYLCSIGEDAYGDYLKSLGVDAEEAAGKAIVYAKWKDSRMDQDKLILQEGDVARYEKGDKISFIKRGQDGEIVADEELEVLLQTDTEPISLSYSSTNTVVLIVSDQWLESSSAAVGANLEYAEVYIRCSNAGKVEQLIRGQYPLSLAMSLSNYEASYNEERSMYLVIAIFLYGFVAVVALIGVTNIFNTITTNMELRAPEFAMLRAVGMSEREFRRMIWLEGLFYGGKALVMGIPLGLLISLGFYGIFSKNVIMDYHPPLLGTGLSVAAVAVLLYGIMRYSMGKINRKNIVETIRNENL